MSRQSSEVDLTALPTPDHITLLLKHHKSTTVISVLPTQPIAEVKALLLAALKSRNFSNLPGSDIPLPTQPNDFEFGVLADAKDASKGWVPLEIKEQDSKDVKGVRRKIGKGNTSNNSSTGTGLVDGTWIAYRVQPSTQSPALEDGDPTEMDMDTKVVEWDVVLPQFEDE